ncbi:MAG: hypothetical protein Q7J76_04205 [Candidatus Brocadiaceae bacterium]|uniref:hypothetical protein n=1 Tax=Candidatus Wunengus sp. YC61 TaxID=3367698 RepID=UPI002725DF74|nr:hypothetical protein [Candidatus Brocadiaceae bacterium]
MLSKIDDDITLIDPQKELDKGVEKAEVYQPILLEAQWQTPGLYLAQKVARNPLVRFVGENLQTDIIQVVIIVEDDPEDLVDSIFSAEQEMYNKFNKLRFDVRLRVIPVKESIEIIKKSTIRNYDRDIFKPKL